MDLNSRGHQKFTNSTVPFIADRKGAFRRLEPGEQALALERYGLWRTFGYEIGSSMGSRMKFDSMEHAQASPPWADILATDPNFESAGFILWGRIKSYFAKPRNVPQFVYHLAAEECDADPKTIEDNLRPLRYVASSVSDFGMYGAVILALQGKWPTTNVDPESDLLAIYDPSEDFLGGRINEAILNQLDQVMFSERDFGLPPGDFLAL